MGLLGDLFSKVTGSDTGASSEHTAINSIFELLNHNQIGGLEGLVSKMTNGGLGNIINSWISTGKNESINSNQISNVLGSDVIGQFASKLGISPDEAKDKIATYLPMIVDKLTPNGNITSTGQASNIQDILGSVLNK